ncbi:MAG: YiiX/YebB-like N1pC/P60 family cysteine hydrolase [Ferruginibacter sp.]
MKPLNKICIRWLQGCLIFFVAGCSSQAKQKIISPPDGDRSAFVKRAFAQVALSKKIIRNADIITRIGNDFTSQSLKTLNRRDQTWSHCGIASIENDTLYVYHALGGEWNPDEKIKKDLFEDFAEPYSNNGIGIYRLAIGDIMLNKITFAARCFKNAGVRFDMKFNLESDDRMYCAEFVCKALKKGSNNQLKINHSFINKFEFIGVDDIFLQPCCREVKKILYK